MGWPFARTLDGVGSDTSGEFEWTVIGESELHGF